MFGDSVSLAEWDEMKDREGLGDRGPRAPKQRGAVVERDFRRMAALEGWTVSKRGWPDFILRRGDEIRFVEVKSWPEQQLKQHQAEVATLLSDAGFNVYKWNPETGFCKLR